MPRELCSFESSTLGRETSLLVFGDVVVPVPSPGDSSDSLTISAEGQFSGISLGSLPKGRSVTVSSQLDAVSGDSSVGKAVSV